MHRKYVWLIAVAAFMISVSGCARGVKIKKIVPTPEEYRQRGIVKVVEAEVPERKLRVGEKFIYEVSWNGIPVGEATSTVKEIVKIRGNDAYRIISTAKSNRWLSVFYRINDTIESYVDVNGLFSYRYEQRLDHGRYKADEYIDFDQVNHVGSYKSRISGETKEVEIPPKVQDALSCIYYYRTLPVKVGESVFIDANVDEKNYNLEIKALEYQYVKIPKFGSFDTLLIKPQAKLRGVFVRKGKMLIWATSDKRRIPLVMKMKAPIGSVYAVLKEME